MVVAIAHSMHVEVRGHLARVSPGDETPAIRLGGRCFYLVGHLDGPNVNSYESLKFQYPLSLSRHEHVFFCWRHQVHCPVKYPMLWIVSFSPSSVFIYSAHLHIYHKLVSRLWAMLLKQENQEHMYRCLLSRSASHLLVLFLKVISFITFIM